MVKNFFSSLPYLQVTNGGKPVKIENTPENLAAYIANEGRGRDITVLSPNNKVLLSTCGSFISKCVDSKYLFETLTPEIVKAQVENKRCEVKEYVKSATVAHQTNKHRR